MPTSCFSQLVDRTCLIKSVHFVSSPGIIFLHYLPMLLFLRRPKRTRLQWMRDMPALTSQQNKQTSETAKQSKKKESKKASKECQLNGNQEKRNSVRRKDAQLIKQASSSSSQHQQHSSVERANTLDSPPPAKQPLQQLNVTTLPMGSNLMQPPPPFPPLHNHFHTLAGHHHFHHHHPPSLLAMQSAAHFHHPTCTLTPQAEQLQHHHLNAGSQQAIPPLHYGSDAHLMRSLDSNLSGNLISANFDPLNHLLNAGDLAADLSALPAHSCLPPSLLNEVDQQNENLNHLNLHHNLDAHLEFGLHRNESNELAADRCSTLPRPMQSAGPPADYASQRTAPNGSAAPPNVANATTKQINPRQASCESSSSGAFYLSQAAFKATEAIEFIAEHLRNEDEYIQVGCWICYSSV